MKKAFDIAKWGKVLIIVLSALFLLSACSENTNVLSYQSPTRISDDDQSATQPVFDSCFYNGILSSVYNIIGPIVMQMYAKLSAGAMSVMMMGFAIWTALRLMKFVSSVAEDSPGEIWNEILKKAFICLFCGLLASSPSMLLYVINHFLFPIYEAFLEFGSDVLAEALDKDKNGNIVVLGETLTIKEFETNCKIPPNATKANLEGFPTGFRDMMECMVCAVDNRLNIGKSVAWIVMKGGTLMGIVLGALLWCIFLVVGLGFVFYFVDSIFRFGMMILLLPILIMSYAFGPTRKWTSIGFNNIMNSAAFMMAFSIIIATTLMAITTLLNNYPGVFNPVDNPTLAAKYLEDFSIPMMCLLLMAFLIYGSLKVSQQLTSAIVGGKTSSKFQENLKAVLQTAVGIVTGGMGYAIKKAGFENSKLGQALNKGKAVKGRLNQLAGRD